MGTFASDLANRPTGLKGLEYLFVPVILPQDYAKVLSEIGLLVKAVFWQKHAVNVPIVSKLTQKGK
jgi:hypothetical protein